MKTKPVYFKSDINDARKWGRQEREKEILEIIDKWFVNPFFQDQKEELKKQIKEQSK